MRHAPRSVAAWSASGFQRGSADRFSDAFTLCAVAAVGAALTLCAVAAAVGAALAPVLVPRGKPRRTGGPHVH
ncbi:hypothetical protein [Streptomyces sp. CB02400]|uniref:hypothetical protein n=1 Tax=Streptomyces sp. CB02400 TaxID=1703944 RepID=UPI00093BA54D|nr:hypothetical protein [Streptomyces sp. CB02400]OKK10994.1 hypothetical protein AMK33_12795 [Streptomyces sp. CB02400]